jgi:lipoate-protein ligase A
MSLNCRLIIDDPAAGDWNMAVDEVLLESVAAGGEAALRLYQWSEPTLSLGYFQPYADRESHLPSRELPAVRRSSGGGALVHDHELTYSLALPASSPHARDSIGLTCLTHQAIIASVEELSGEESRLTTCSTGIPVPRTDEPFLCFSRRAEGDLLVTPPQGGPQCSETGDRLHKVCGSAQRKRRGAVLQHGGILLGRSVAAPELPGLFELGFTRLERAELADLVYHKISDRLGLQLLRDNLTSSENSAASSLVIEKFGLTDWLRRR